MSKEYEFIIHETMNFFIDLINNKENIKFIVSNNLDLKIWNILTERHSKILKYKLSKEHLGKNASKQQFLKKS